MGSLRARLPGSAGFPPAMERKAPTVRAGKMSALPGGRRSRAARGRTPGFVAVQHPEEPGAPRLVARRGPGPAAATRAGGANPAGEKGLTGEEEGRAPARAAAPGPAVILFDRADLVSDEPHHDVVVLVQRVVVVGAERRVVGLDETLVAPERLEGGADRVAVRAPRLVDGLGEEVHRVVGVGGADRARRRPPRR